jgi:hypothetical protein
MNTPSASSDATNTTVLELFGRHGELANLPSSRTSVRSG